MLDSLRTEVNSIIQKTKSRIEQYKRERNYDQACFLIKILLHFAERYTSVKCNGYYLVNPQVQSTLFNVIAGILRKQNKYTESCEYLTQSLNLETRCYLFSGRTNAGLAISYTKLKRIEQARIHSTRAVKQLILEYRQNPSPKLIEILSKIGINSFALGGKEMAESAWNVLEFLEENKNRFIPGTPSYLLKEYLKKSKPIKEDNKDQKKTRVLLKKRSNSPLKQSPIQSIHNGEIRIKRNSSLPHNSSKGIRFSFSNPEEKIMASQITEQDTTPSNFFSSNSHSQNFSRNLKLKIENIGDTNRSDNDNATTPYFSSMNSISSHSKVSPTLIRPKFNINLEVLHEEEDIDISKEKSDHSQGEDKNNPYIFPPPARPIDPVIVNPIYMRGPLWINSSPESNSETESGHLNGQGSIESQKTLKKMPKFNYRVTSSINALLNMIDNPNLFPTSSSSSSIFSSKALAPPSSSSTSSSGSRVSSPEPTSVVSVGSVSSGLSLDNINSNNAPLGFPVAQSEQHRPSLSLSIASSPTLLGRLCLVQKWWRNWLTLVAPVARYRSENKREECWRFWEGKRCFLVLVYRYKLALRAEVWPLNSKWTPLVNNFPNDIQLPSHTHTRRWKDILRVDVQHRHVWLQDESGDEEEEEEQEEGEEEWTSSEFSSMELEQQIY